MSKKHMKYLLLIKLALVYKATVKTAFKNY